MLKLLTDEHIDPDLVRGLLARQPELDLIRVHDVGLLGERMIAKSFHGPQSKAEFL